MGFPGIDISDDWLDFAICNEAVEFQTKKKTVDNRHYLGLEELGVKVHGA